MQLMEQGIKDSVIAIIKKIKNVIIDPSPFQSLLSKRSLELARDISQCGKYNNIGVHGPGIATVVDSLKAIKKYIFDEKAYSAQEFQKAVQNNFIGFEKLRWTLKNQTEKWGNNEEEVDQIAVKILDMFAEACKGKKQNLGGGLRPGTGPPNYMFKYQKRLGRHPMDA